MVNSLTNSQMFFQKYEDYSINRLFCIFAEISNHNFFNQFQGYSSGENLASKVQEVLEKLVKPFSVHRFAFNEFVILGTFEHPDSDKHDLENDTFRANYQHELMQRITDFFNRTVHQGLRVQLRMGSASNGIKQEAKNPEDLVQLAHYTLDRARERHLMHLTSDEAIRDEKVETYDFMHAFEYEFDINEFLPYFHPIVSGDGRTIIGCETLARWQKDDYRIINAQKFKQVAIEKGVIKQIDWSVIEKTFAAYNTWRNQALIDDTFYLVLNLSENFLLTSEVVAIKNLAFKYDIDITNIEFDLDESSIHNPDTFDKIKLLKNEGFRIAIDAFFNENFAFKTLLSFDVDTLKIDRQFLNDETFPDRQKRLYEAIIKMAKHLNLQTLAKGVETHDQLDFARQMSVDFLQGYYFTRPVDEAGFSLLLNKYKNGFIY